MSNKKTETFIAELVRTHRPRRVLRPAGRRAAVWCALAVLLAAAVFSFVQPFRSDFCPHMLAHPMLFLEMLSAALFVWIGAVWAFQCTVPGRRVPALTNALFAGSGIVFAATVALSFSRLGAEATAHGGRAECWLEVIVCGGATLVALILFLRRGYPRFTVFQVWLVALIAMLPAAAIMQLACAYNPLHGLLFHYMPMWVLALIALSAKRYLRR